MDAFGQPLHDAGDTNLVHHLGQLTVAGWTDQLDAGSEATDHGFGFGIGSGIAAHHYRERPLLRSCLTAGYRRIEEIQAALLRRCCQLTCHDGRGGCVINNHTARLGACENSLRACHYLAQVIIVANAGEDEVCALGCGCWSSSGVAAVLLLPFSCLGCCSVVNRDSVPCLDQMAGHRETHGAKADECCFGCHDCSCVV